MKKLKLLPKTFIYTISIMSVIVLFVHGLIYFGLPRFYYQQKQEDAQEELTMLIEKMKETPEEEVVTLVGQYATQRNINLNLRINQKQEYQFQGFTSLKIEYSSELTDPLSIYLDDGTGKMSPIIVTQDQFKAHGQTYEVQLMLNIQPIEEAKQMTVKLLPYTLLLSLFLASIAAYFYSRILTRPIKEVLLGTKKMEQLQPDVFIQVSSADEMGDLAENINDLYENLWQTIDSLEDKIRILGEVEEEKVHFLRGASHELKTPLTSLSILLENMQLNIGPYKDRETYLVKAQEIVMTLSAMLQNLLESSQLKTLPLESGTAISLTQTLKRTLSDYEILAKTKKLQLMIDIEEEEGFYPIPEKELSKVFSNLISNSIYYTKTGEKIKIRLTSHSFSIENTGVTMLQSELDDLFQPFYRPDFSRNKNTGGTGLGLYIVKTILDYYQLPFSFTSTKNSLIFKIDFD